MLKIHFAITFILLLLTTSTVAQFNMSGNIVNEEKEPLEFVNVVVTDELGVFVKGSVTDSTGLFNLKLKEGEYNLNYSFVGFEEEGIKVLVNENKVLGEIVLKLIKNELETVEVVSRRPTVVRKIDRLVFTVKNTILSDGDAWEILKKTPGVTASSSGVIQIHGKPGIVVMINERPVQLSSSELKSMLEGMSASDIEAIEVITNPPAKYGAEGVGILNIKMIAKQKAGYDVSIRSKYTQARYAKYSNGLTGSYKGEKLDFYASYNFDNGERLALENSDIYFLNPDSGLSSSWDEDARIKTDYNSHNYRLSGNLYLSDKSILGVQASGRVAPDKSTNNFAETNVQDDEGSFSSLFVNDNNLASSSENSSYNINYEQKLDNKGKLNFDFDYARYREDEEQVVSTDFFDKDLMLLDNEKFTSFSDQNIDLFSGKVDYKMPLDSVTTFETGFKYNEIETDNDLVYINHIDGEDVFDDLRSNNFIYNENTFAAYTSASRMYSKLTIQVGLRGEYTLTRGNSLTLEKENRNNNFQLFPTLFLKYKLPKGNSMGFTYGRRISRPRFALLNPFQFYNGPYSFIEGNPFLKPTITNNYGLTYSVNRKYFFKIFCYDSRNPFTQLSIQDNEDQVFKYLAVNLDKRFMIGSSFNTSFDLNSWWNMFFQMNYYYKQDEFVDQESNEIIKNGRWNNYGLFLLNTMTLSRKYNLSMELQGVYSSVRVQGGFILEPISEVSFGLKKKLFKKRASISVYVTDIFNKNLPVLNSNYANQSHVYREKLENQRVRVAFSYKFNDQSVKTRSRKSSVEEEKERM